LERWFSELAAKFQAILRDSLAGGATIFAEPNAFLHIFVGC
jgi:hypothetical protein